MTIDEKLDKIWAKVTETSEKVAAINATIHEAPCKALQRHTERHFNFGSAIAVALLTVLGSGMVSFIAWIAMGVSKK